MSYALYKILSSLTEPLSLFAVLLLLAAFLAVSSWERGRKTGRILTLFLALILFSMLIFPIGYWALAPLENRYAPSYPAKVDGILMLTGSENAALSEARGVPITDATAQRHIVLARLARKYPKAKLVVIGNPTPSFKSKKTSTQTVVQANLDAMGIPASRVLYEPDSRTTYENAVFTTRMVKPKKGETWLLVTSAYHMPRSVLCFEKEGWDVVPYPTDYFTFPKMPRFNIFSLDDQARLLTRASHEYLGLLSYWMRGRIARLWR